MSKRITPNKNKATPNPNKEPEWNVAWVNAPALWARNFTGRGIVLAIADTGVHHTHEAIVNSYRGNIEGRFVHDYNWFDPAGNRSDPIDGNGHGTHVTGTIAGGSHGRQIGVSPGAKWIHCRAFTGGGTPANFIRCLQFFLAPHDLQGRNPNPDLRPHVSSHSYVCSGCNMLQSIRALRAAGSLFVKSCGNSGPRCTSITEPGFYREVICAGALSTRSDVITSFSSRGPRDNVTKPDFSAPGQNVNSAAPGASNNIYRSLSGTSMASPCLAGSVGLLWSAVPRLARNIDTTIEIFAKTSKKQPSNECSSNGTPNNVYGHGTIDVLKAYEEAIRLGY